MDEKINWKSMGTNIVPIKYLILISAEERNAYRFGTNCR